MAFLLAKPTPLNVNHGNDRFSMFNKKRDIAGTVTLVGTVHDWVEHDAIRRAAWSAPGVQAVDDQLTFGS